MARTLTSGLPLVCHRQPPRRVCRVRACPHAQHEPRPPTERQEQRHDHQQRRAAATPPLPAWRAWPATARVALRTGTYISALGLGLMVAPTTLFSLAFDAQLVTRGWIRVGGTLALLIGAYYIGAAVDDARGACPRALYAATVAGRLLLSAVFTALVAAAEGESGLLVLAVVNAASAGALWRAVRQRNELERHQEEQEGKEEGEQAAPGAAAAAAAAAA